MQNIQLSRKTFQVECQISNCGISGWNFTLTPDPFFDFQLCKFCNSMNYQFKRGDKLVFELVNSDDILQGEYMNGSKDRVTLINITSHKNSYIIKGPYSYYRSDIVSLRLLDELEGPKYSVNYLDNTSISQSNSSFILISKSEYERLMKMSQNYIYMSTIDSRYYNAMECIKNCETIGFSGITTSYDRTANFNIIIISTWSQIYIFDFLALKFQKFPLELKLVLESKYVKKVLHDSRLLTEILAKCFDVKLTNIFDTQVADVLARKKKGENFEEVRSISECLTHYFNLPSTLFDSQEKKLNEWKKRPLPNFKKLEAAHMVTFLLMLKEHLEHILLENFYISVSNYSRSLQHCSITQVTSRLFDNKLDKILQNVKLD